MKVAVGLSGGVDSTLAAALLREAGHDVVGVTMTLGRADEAASLAAARKAAAHLGVPLKVFDFADAWRKHVLGYLRSSLLAGETPNPCVACNEAVKLGLLPQAAFAWGAERFATGHYARLERAPGGEVRLLRGVDRRKDQSYFLYRVAADVLARTLLPLGGYTKDEVRALARERGLAASEQPDSQDFCGGDPRAVVTEAPRPGDVVGTDGRVLGRHRGFWQHTVGQRKGLGIGGGVPFYVVRLDAERNQVVVGTRAEAVSAGFRVRDVVVRAAAALDGRPLAVKVRSAGEPRGPVAVAWNAAGTELEVEAGEGFPVVAPGQSAVFFAGDEVVAGGVIAGGGGDRESGNFKTKEMNR